jgi:hypothetical protein
MGPRVVAALIAYVSVMIPVNAIADEGGVSFWVPGFFGSLAAVPTGPGFGLDTFFYDTNVNAGADVAIAREFQIGRLNPTLTLTAAASVHANFGFEWINPVYAFATPILGGQLSVGAGTLVGYGSTTLQGTVTASVPPFSVTRSDNITDTVAGNGDLYPQVMWKWHNSVNNVLLYATGDVPVGQYSSTSLANLGIGHGAADGGFGYTYLDEKTGREFSQLLGDLHRRGSLFIVYEGVKIARRGYYGTPDEGTWVSLQPGWEVRDAEDFEALEIHYDGDRMH